MITQNMRSFKGKKWIVRVLVALYVLPFLFVLMDAFLFGWLEHLLQVPAPSSFISIVGHSILFTLFVASIYFLYREDCKALPKKSLAHKIYRIILIGIVIASTIWYAFAYWFINSIFAPVNTFEVHDPQGRIYTAQEMRTKHTYYQIVEKRFSGDYVVGRTRWIISYVGIKDPTRFMLYSDGQSDKIAYCLDINTKMLLEPGACEDAVAQ